MDLVAFLKARLDEDEQIARAAIADDGGQDGGFEDALWLDDRSHPLCARIAKDAANLIRATAVPRRVLADIQAGRRLIQAHSKWCQDECEATYPNVGPDAAYYWEIRNRASVYASHPDYQEKWRP